MAISPYVCATRCPVLSARMAALDEYNAMVDRVEATMTGISLRACYAMSGTDIAYATKMTGISLRACYAMSGTDI
eukprot:3301299-Rhodomonas_salina.3